MMLRIACLVLAAALVLPLGALSLAVWLEPLPEALLQKPESSLELYDSQGRLIRAVRTRGSVLSNQVRFDQLSPAVVPALLAAEDARFFRHPGVDPLALVRAGAQMIRAGRVVSGASTITQQLARTIVPRPRTLLGKSREVVIALRIERELTKQQILEEYLNRVDFGPNLRGIEVASHTLFDKPPSALSLSEAATLVALPQSPTRYDPRRDTTQIQMRRNRILARLEQLGSFPEDEIARARQAPIQVQQRATTGGAEHLAQALVSRDLVPELNCADRPFLSRIETTIDGALQTEVETAARRAADALSIHDATALAVLVVENSSGDVLAYLGSPRFGADAVLGQNDGVLALRQPGSTLKPFLYAAALSDLGMTPASLLPDLDLYLKQGDHDVYAPKNYNRRSHGPVRLREALANSLNVPAVWTAQKLGIESLLARLRDLGFESLIADATHYGAALALGDGEVRLSELVGAYATLARGGIYRPLRTVRRAFAGGQSLELDSVPERRVFDQNVAATIADILSDREARSSAFGVGSSLELPFEVAAKTGTSKGFRDNWTVGFTREVTVGVWVGNFDGRPLIRSSGVTGAAPLFRTVMLAAMRAKKPAPLIAAGLVPTEVCGLSGELPGPSCTERIREVFIPGDTPARHCTMHEQVPIVRNSGLRAGPGCSHASLQVFERYPAEYASWAHAAHRPLAPDRFDPRCPGTLPETQGEVAVVFPPQGSRFVRDDLALGRQEIVLEGRGPDLARASHFLLNGKRLPARSPFRVPWLLTPGRHHLRLVVDGAPSPEVVFHVL